MHKLVLIGAILVMVYGFYIILSGFVKAYRSGVIGYSGMTFTRKKNPVRFRLNLLYDLAVLGMILVMIVASTYELTK